VAALATAEAARASAAQPSTTLRLERGSFAEHLGQTFVVSGAVGRTTARLVAVEDLTSSDRRHDPDRFSLIFRSARPLPGGQGMFHLHRRGRRGIDAFVVPVDRGVSGFCLQVVVNRRASSPTRNRRQQ
jgi:hypothetical protein